MSQTKSPEVTMLQEFLRLAQRAAQERTMRTICSEAVGSEKRVKHDCSGCESKLLRNDGSRIQQRHHHHRIGQPSPWTSGRGPQDVRWEVDALWQQRDSFLAERGGSSVQDTMAVVGVNSSCPDRTSDGRYPHQWMIGVVKGARYGLR